MIKAKNMNKSLLILSLAVSLSSLVASCAKTITCSDGTVAISPVGFSKNDFDSAFVVRYKQDDAFDSSVDSSYYIYYSTTGSDTGSLAINSVYATNGVHPPFLIPGYDYKLFLPTAGRSFTITNIVQNGNKTQSYSDGVFHSAVLVTCTNCIVSCKLDGTPVTSASNAQNVRLTIVK